VCAVPADAAFVSYFSMECEFPVDQIALTLSDNVTDQAGLALDGE